MRPGMIILMVLGLLGIIGDCWNAVSYVILATTGDNFYSGLYWAMFGGTLPLLFFSAVIVSFLAKWLGSRDKAADRAVLIKAMWLGVFQGAY